MATEKERKKKMEERPLTLRIVTIHFTETIEGKFRSDCETDKFYCFEEYSTNEIFYFNKDHIIMIHIQP
jgi:hypothetical protein